MTEQIAIAEIPKDERTRALLDQAVELIFVEVGQKELGDSADDPIARQEYVYEVANNRLFVGVSNTGDVVGAATLSSKPSKSHLSSIAVSSEYRRRHIGDQLLSTVERAAKEDGAEKLDVYPTSDSTPFYLAQGFKIVVDSGGELLSPGSTYLSKELHTPTSHKTS